jgi:hypothetical protein
MFLMTGYEKNCTSLNPSLSRMFGLDVFAINLSILARLNAGTWQNMSHGKCSGLTSSKVREVATGAEAYFLIEELVCVEQNHDHGHCLLPQLTLFKFAMLHYLNPYLILTLLFAYSLSLLL